MTAGNTFPKYQHIGSYTEMRIQHDDLMPSLSIDDLTLTATDSQEAEKLANIVCAWVDAICAAEVERDCNREIVSL